MNTNQILLLFYVVDCSSCVILLLLRVTGVEEYRGQNEDPIIGRAMKRNSVFIKFAFLVLILVYSVLSCRIVL